MDSEFIDHESEVEVAGHVIPMVAGDSIGEQMENLAEAIKDTAPLDRIRPYTCQQPKRHQQIVSGLTMRDISDCIIRGFLLSAKHVNPKGYDKVEAGTCCHEDLYGWNLNKIDPGAVLKNTGCEIEKMMGIYPNMLDFSDWDSG